MKGFSTERRYIERTTPRSTTVVAWLSILILLGFVVMFTVALAA